MFYLYLTQDSYQTTERITLKRLAYRILHSFIVTLRLVLGHFLVISSDC